MDSNEYYELRYIDSSPFEDSFISLLEQNKRNLTLLDIISIEDCIFLLGNPGSGKTTELAHVFHSLWKNKQQNQLVPLSINIKNFRTSSIIEDLIKVDSWAELPAIAFIIDGLDEIANVQDFTAALQNFMRDYNHLNLKFIISCRTNIYQKNLVDIPGFKVVYLKNLTYGQVQDIFEKKYNIEISDPELLKYYTILQLPFNVEMFATYYKKEGQFPETIKKAWELVINEELNVTMERLLKKGINQSKPEIFNIVEKVAFANELMQKSTISEQNIFELVKGVGVQVLSLAPFVERKLGNNDYFIFIHKNYQEYFASKYIASQRSDKLIEFLKIEGYQKIKPSLFNTATFLLNILEGEKLKDLVEWLLENEIEILFFADEGRLLPEIQHEIFEKYFTELCINKTFWITHYNRISLEIFAKFADFNFLFKQTKNSDIPERARMSALEVLGHMSLTSAQKTELKLELLSFLEKEPDNMKAEVLRTIKALNFHTEDPAYCSRVLDIASQFMNSDITNQIIQILNDLPDGERDEKLLLDVITKHYSIQDNTIRNTESAIANILLNTDSIELHLDLLKLFFSDQFSLRPSAVFFDNFDELLIRRAVEFSEANKTYTKRLMELAFSEPYMIASNDLLKNILSRIGISPELIVHILKTQQMSPDALYTITSFLTKASIDAIIAEYKEGGLKFIADGDIERFRNWLSNVDYEKGLYLEEKFIAEKYEFSQNLPTEAESKKKNADFESFKLYNFNLLFDTQMLCDEIKKYFLTNEIAELSRKDYQRLFFAWYDKEGFHGIQYTVHTVLDIALRTFNSVKADEVCEMLKNDPHFHLSVIKAALSHFSLRTMTLQPAHISLMADLVNAVRRLINFDQVIESINRKAGNYTLNSSFDYIKLVLYFDLNYDLIQDTDFYLNALPYGNLDGYREKDNRSFIEHVIERVGDLKAVNEKITYNINNTDLILMSKTEHYYYAIKNDLKDTFGKIGEEILEDSELIDHIKILQVYIQKIEDPQSFLKQCCKEPKSYFYWEAIRLIKENFKDDAFILEAALTYLQSDDINFIEYAVNILFFLNQDNALRNYYYALLKILDKRPDSGGFMPKDFMCYTHLSEISVFINIFELIGKQALYSSFYLYSVTTFLNSLTSWLCRTEIGYNELYKVLLDINENHTFSQNDVHRINDLINTADSRYFETKSGELSFEQALNLII